jgi:uncharacterized membrane protein YjfL (UPF0719 family)
MELDRTVSSVLLSALFALLGFVLLFVGYRVFDMLTPTEMSRKIFDEGNVAVAVLAGAFVIGLAIVVASAIS